MGVKQWVRAMLVLSAMSPAVHALGLGDIRLNSTLNAPLDAEIELVNATPDELASLRAQLASRETFARYGLEWPSFLSNVTVTRAKSRDGRDVLRVQSNVAITEPFVTLLVDANWGRGRLVREYTMLLDPPVFAPAAPAAAPVAGPATSATRSGTVERPAAPAPRRDAAPTSGIPTDSYTVQRGDTLSGIAARLAADATREQAMVALYRANPQAFDGTMNDLRAGAVLRVPDAATLASESPAAAAAEVRRQGSIWRGRSAAAPAAGGGTGEGRLRLVAPTETAASAAGASGVAGTREAEQLRGRLTELEAELANTKRLLELRNNELAELQRRLGGAATAPPATAADAGADTTAGTPSDPAPVDPAPLDPAAPDADATDPAIAAPPAVATEEEVAPPMQAKPRRERPEPAAEEPSMFAGILDALKQFWFVPVGLLALIGGLLGFRRWQASKDADLDDTFVNVDAAARELTTSVPPASGVSADTARIRRPNIAAKDDTGLVVEESGEYQQPRIDTAAARATPSVSTEDTFSGETGINLDQGDPLAEADFHMAYGLYDQAADLIRLAVAREPQRRDLKLKLAEVFFVWGNKDEFLNTARELHATEAAGAPGDWDKVVIMGKQIAPEDPLFAGAAMRSGADASVDLRLDEGSSSIDFDVFGDGSGPQLRDGATATDIDFGAALGDNDATGERTKPPAPADTATIQLDTGGATTREMTPNFAATQPDTQGLDFDLGATASTDMGEAPTVEQPALRAGSPTIKAKLDAALGKAAPGNDQTAEIALDDLGLDLGDATGLDQPDMTIDAPLSADGPTLVANMDGDGIDVGASLTDLDDTSRRLIDAASAPTEVAPRPNFDSAATAEMPMPDVDAAPDAGSTSMIAQLDLDKFEKSLDFNLGDTAMAQLPDGDGTVQVDMNEPDATQGDLTLPSLEPVTISEVGTKLDLARAYMDMGDPDGARSILREVLAEGSVSQKQEAERLLGSLPG
ncbi:MAG: FimV/HubP family polar landmark protein [Steroidobacteraceae bacterium]